MGKYDGYPKPVGWHEHGSLCDCYRCDDHDGAEDDDFHGGDYGG